MTDSINQPNNLGTTAYERLHEEIMKADKITIPAIYRAIYDGSLKNYATLQALQTQIARIDKLTKLPEGSTTGDAELVDARIGADGITYDTLGAAIRTNIQNIYSVLLPSYYPNLIKEATLNTNSVQKITCDLTSVYIEQIQDASSERGITINLNSSIEIIEFDIEYCNFGMNTGVFLFKSGGIVHSHITKVDHTIDTTIRHDTVKFKLDWNELTSKMMELGADKCGLVIWSDKYAKQGGYVRASSIKFNGYVPADILYEKLSKIDNAIFKNNGTISDINNEKVRICTTSDMENWQTSNMTYDSATDTISFSYSSSTGNNGFNSPSFKFYNNLIKITGNILTLNEEYGQSGMGITLYGKDKVTKEPIYMSIKAIRKTGVFEVYVDKASVLSTYPNIDLDNIAIIFSNWNRVDLTLTALNIYNIDSRYEGNTLENILTAIDNKKYENITRTDRVIMEDLSELDTWGSTNYSYYEDTLIYEYTNTSGNNGLVTKAFTSNTNFVIVSGYVEELIKTDANAKMQIYIYGNKVSDGNETYLTVGKIEKTGSFKFIIDLNELVVYKDLDLNKPIKVLLGNAYRVKIVLKNYKVYETDTYAYELIEDNLKDTLVNMNASINDISTKLNEVGKDASVKLTAPNGNKYILQVADDGSFVTIPVIPNKVLFIGNSLLLGNKTFGMCASNSSNDYYYHVVQYLKSKNPSVIGDKQQGSVYESAETQSACDTWINTNINSKATDYDLVIIQLGDNVNTTAKQEMFKTSCKQLLQAVRNHMPKAKVVWMGEWYANSTKQDIIASSCADTGCTFIDISDLYISANKASIGDTITYDDGTTSTVTSSGVASHPSNVGMKAIANRIIATLFE